MAAGTAHGAEHARPIGLNIVRVRRVSVLTPTGCALVHALARAPEGMSRSEVADAIGIALASVQTTVSMARLALRSVQGTIHSEGHGDTLVYRLEIPRPEELPSIAGDAPSFPGDGDAHGFPGLKGTIIRTLTSAAGGFVQIPDIAQAAYGRSTDIGRRCVIRTINEIRNIMKVRGDVESIVSSDPSMPLSYAWRTGSEPADASPGTPQAQASPRGITLAPCGHDAWIYQPSNGPQGSRHIVKIRGESDYRALTAFDIANGRTTADAPLVSLDTHEEVPA